MFFEKYINNDCIEESVQDGINEAHSEIANMFQHMLKFIYQSNRQDSSWYNTILDTHIYISNITNTSVINGIDLDRCYAKGRRDAKNATGLPDNIFPKRRPIEWDYNFITNKEAIIYFLEINYNPNAIYNIPKEQIREEMNKKLRNAKNRKRK